MINNIGFNYLVNATSTPIKNSNTQKSIAFTSLIPYTGLQKASQSVVEEGILQKATNMAKKAISSIFGFAKKKPAPPEAVIPVTEIVENTSNKPLSLAAKLRATNTDNNTTVRDFLRRKNGVEVLNKILDKIENVTEEAILKSIELFNKTLERIQEAKQNSEVMKLIEKRRHNNSSPIVLALEAKHSLENPTTLALLGNYIGRNLNRLTECINKSANNVQNALNEYTADLVLSIRSWQDTANLSGFIQKSNI